MRETDSDFEDDHSEMHTFFVNWDKNPCGASIAITKNNILKPGEANWNVFACHLCQVSFIDIESLLKHREFHKSKVKDLSCSICGKEYKTAAAQIMHIRKHLKIRPFKCFQCNKTFPSRDQQVMVDLRMPSDARQHFCRLLTSRDGPRKI